MPVRRTRLFSCAEPPKRINLIAQELGPANSSARATRSSSPGLSITPTSCRGSCCASRQGRSSRWHRSTTAVKSCLTSTASCSGRAQNWSSFTQVSNALGTITPAKVMTDMAHAVGARVLLDGAQSVSHMRSDVQALDVDWFVFSGHKVFGADRDRRGVRQARRARGVTAVARRRQHDRGRDVRADRVSSAPPAGSRPGRETSLTRSAWARHSSTSSRSGIESDRPPRARSARRIATRLLLGIPGLRMHRHRGRKGRGASRSSSTGIDPVEVGTALNQDGIAVRAGHHCAQPILRRFGLESTVRASLALYNTLDEIDALAASVRRIQSKRVPHHGVRSTG